MEKYGRVEVGNYKFYDKKEQCVLELGDTFKEELYFDFKCGDVIKIETKIFSEELEKFDEKLLKSIKSISTRYLIRNADTGKDEEKLKMYNDLKLDSIYKEVYCAKETVKISMLLTTSWYGKLKRVLNKEIF